MKFAPGTKVTVNAAFDEDNGMVPMAGTKGVVVAQVNDSIYLDVQLEGFATPFLMLESEFDVDSPILDALLAEQALKGEARLACALKHNQHGIDRNDAYLAGLNFAINLLKEQK